MAIVVLVVLVISKLFSFFSLISSATDVITQSQPLPDGSTLVSSGGTFELGFFNPGNSTNRYVGLWYKNIPVRRVVWVANRNNPIRDNSSKLIISQDGNLVLLNQNQTLLWSANVTRKATSPIVRLLENGNLVLKDGKDDNNNNNSEQSFLWQSFDHPSDTILPGLKFRWDRKNAVNNSLSAWKNWDDPSTGDLTFGIVHGNRPVMMMWKGFKPFCRLGPWNGISLSGSVAMKNNPLYNIKVVNNEDEVSSMYTLKNSSVVSIIVLNQTLYRGQWLTWVPLTRTWTEYLSWPQDKCDEHNFCGAYANCIPGAWPKCHCLNGFQPKSPQNWNAMDWRQGCVRSDTWSCGVKNRDGFRRFARMKLPDTLHSWVDASMILEDCKIKCLENCSCTAYANLDVRGAGSGCAIWFDDLNDMRITENGQDLYVRMVTSDADDVNADAKQGHKRKLVLGFTITVVLVLSTLPFICWRRTKCRGKSLLAKKKDAGEQEDFELPFFDITTIINATNNFSNDNKLGKGGFGPVYKGTLQDGQEIAVKRLSSSSSQGVNEFKNEVILCAKLQHRNLVKVLGYCLEGDEKMLLYEYMPNRSLDSFIFDSTRSILLDWSKRYHILHGIARGLLYLHQDSRLRIIHRDLKASNILLDNDMNPKISDFGLARMCRGDQIEGNTSRVVGTFGYMAPEYLKNGLFSTKSDVFSFGVLLLEIISGKRNKGSAYPSNSHNLIGHAWRLWKDGIPEDFIDANFRDLCNLSDVVHCIQIGLLCVQHHLNDRPNITSVVVMLSREHNLPQPKEPTGFLTEIVSHEREKSPMKQASSNNEETMSLLSPR